MITITLSFEFQTPGSSAWKQVQFVGQDAGMLLYNMEGFCSSAPCIVRNIKTEYNY